MNIFLIIQAILSVLLILVIMLQHRAAGLSTNSSVNTTIVQRRGAEKLLYQATYVIAIAFFALTILQWYA